MNIALALAITVVQVTGPDHMRAYRAVKGLQDGNHVFVASPAGRTLEEARIVFASAAKRPGRIAVGDLGPVASADEAVLAKAKTLGKLKRVTAHFRGGLPHLGEARPDGAEPGEEAWRAWLGVMPLRPFRSHYVKDEGWRAYLDFGTGPLGKDGARVLRPVFRALRLDAPLYAERIAVDGEAPDRETYPRKARIRVVFRNDFDLILVWGEGREGLVWEGAEGTLESQASAGVPLAEQVKALEAGAAIPPEAEPLTETILLGCRAAMTPKRVTAADCEQRYVRDGWEWEGL